MKPLSGKDVNTAPDRGNDKPQMQGSISTLKDSYEASMTGEESETIAIRTVARNLVFIQSDGNP